jgi:large subunit ribosomal protein L35
MKLKTRKSAVKRIKSKKNFFARKKAYKAHLLRRKSTKQLRILAQPAQISSSDLRAFNLMLPYN